VKSVQPGKQYVLYPWLGCGMCIPCRDRNSDEIFCQGNEETPPLPTRTFGTSAMQNGGFASHVLVPDEKWLVDPGNCPLPLAATYTCSGLTTYSAVKKCTVSLNGKAQLAPGQWIMIIGAGGLGSHAINWAKVLTDANVLVCENDPAKHANAREMGADLVLDLSKETPEGAAKKIKEATNGGPQAVIDLVGMAPTSRMGRMALRKGGTQVQVGLYGGELNLQVNAFATEHKHLLGNFVGTFEEFLDMMEYVRAGKKKDIPYETRPIEQVNEAIEDLRKGKIIGRCVLLHNHARAKM